MGHRDCCGIHDWLRLVDSVHQPWHEETTEDTGHEYDGIVELDNPMPRWWVILFWGTIVLALSTSASTAL